MTSIHAANVVHTGTARPVSMWLVLLVGGSGLLLVHVIRAARVGERTATDWMRRRNLPHEQRGVLDVVAYLRRLRWARVGSTVLLLVLCGVSLLATKAWVSFVSLPFLLSVLAAETLAPDPRRGRVRVAALDRRSRSFFAPPRVLGVARTAMAAAAALSFCAVFRDAPFGRLALVHGLVMAVGLIALETCLHQTSMRALPDRQPDVAVDTAMRVASARAATAAALVFGVLGLFLSVSFSGVLNGVAGDGASVAVGQVFTLVLLLAIGVSLALVQPLPSWQPRRR
jgi:hypothetical protein